MSDVLQTTDFGLKMYHRFPRRYQEEDIYQKYALKRYLEALADGGMQYIIEDTNNLLTLVNADSVDSDILPVLFKQYGLEVFNGIPDTFLRALLPQLGEAYSKKGSLAVVEFIVSSLSGIRTNTEVLYDEDDNPYVNVRLEMDFALSDYFPDPQQFSRILENFMPFYLDKVLIYAYVYYEQGNFQTIDSDFMEVFENTSETCVLPSSKGVKFYDMIGVTSKVLGDTFITGDTFEISEDPDVFFDKIIGEYLEESNIYAERTLHLAEMLGVKLLNSSFILGEYSESDYTFDSVVYSPIDETQVLNTDDTTTNNIVLFEAESSNLDGNDTDSIKCTGISEDTSEIDRNGDEISDVITAIIHSENTNVGVDEDTGVMTIKWGENKFSLIDMLGTKKRLGADFVLGDNNQDEYQNIKMADSDLIELSFASEDEQKGISVVDDNDTYMLFTGVNKSTLGDALTSIPVSFDVITQGNDKRVYYPTTYGYIG